MGSSSQISFHRCAVLGDVDRVGRRAGDELGRDQAGELQRGLTTERHDHPVRPLGGEDVEHVLAW